MNIAALLDWLHGRGVDAWVHGGELWGRTRGGGPLAPQDADVVRRHADALARYLLYLAKPAAPARPGCSDRPNPLDLAKRHRRLFGSSLVATYRHMTGVDLGTTNPDWPDLEAYEAWLRQEEAELLPALKECERRGRDA